MVAGHPHTGRMLARLEAVTGAARLADAVPLPATPDGSLLNSRSEA